MLVEKGLIEKTEQDGRTNVYILTQRGRRELKGRRDREQQYLAEEDAIPA